MRFQALPVSVRVLFVLYVSSLLLALQNRLKLERRNLLLSARLCLLLLILQSSCNFQTLRVR